MSDKGSYKIIGSEGYVTIHLAGNCDQYSLKGFEEQLNEIHKQSISHIVIHCEQVVTMSNDWIRLLLKIQATIKQSGKYMGLLMQPDLIRTFKREGLETAFRIYPNLKEALIYFGLEKKKSLDTEFINPFLNATLHVLSVQAGIEATPQKIYLKDPGEATTGDISGVIGIVSESFSGSVVISFPEKTFLGIMSGMLGEPYTELNKEIIDGAGEITNMIFGQAKTVLNEKGYGIKIAIPSVITGKDHSLSALTKGPVVVIPFRTSVGSFFIEIGLSN